MKFLKSLYLNNRLFVVAISLVGISLLGFAIPVLLFVAQVLFFVALMLLFIDIIMLYRNANGIEAERVLADKLSNGDENTVQLFVQNNYSHRIKLTIFDEVPEQFQLRDLKFVLSLAPFKKDVVTYILRPVKRGSYHFGLINIFTSSPIGFVAKRYRLGQEKEVPVYPSYLQMRKYELLAISNNLLEQGIKKIRRIGSNKEFEQIKEYVIGDDYRTVNWKATARRGELMVNKYQDERSQQVYSVIDKGRLMKMPFEGMSLLDYAINASLVISNIAIKKDDKAGLITFQHKVNLTLPASKRGKQMHMIQEALYNQKTAYKESDFSKLYITIRRKLNQRSLLLLFTNFESLQSMHRQLPYLRQMAKQHLLVVIFFENTELQSELQTPATNVEEVYTKTIIEKFVYEKKLIVKELQSHGIQALLTAPQKLTVNVINKYLELKSRGLI